MLPDSLCSGWNPPESECSFFDDLSGVEGPLTSTQLPDDEDDGMSDEALEDFMKRMGINYTKVTAREAYGGFKEDAQFGTKSEADQSYDDISNWKKGDPLWVMKEIDGFKYLKLAKPAYACDTSEMNFNRTFTERVKENLLMLGEEDIELAEKENIKSEIKKLFETGERMVNDRFGNKECLAAWKKIIKDKYEIEF